MAGSKSENQSSIRSMIVSIKIHIISPNQDGTFSVFLDSNMEIPTMDLIEELSLDENIKTLLSKYFINYQWLAETLQLVDVRKNVSEIEIEYSVLSPNLKSSNGKFYKITDMAKFMKVLNTLRYFNVAH